LSKNTITIDFLKNNPDSIKRCIEIWTKEGGSAWWPGYTVEGLKKKFDAHQNIDSLPLTLVAYSGNIPVGICSLRENDGLKNTLTP
jgi:hypothetical protein